MPTARSTIVPHLTYVLLLACLAVASFGAGLRSGPGPSSPDDAQPVASTQCGRFSTSDYRYAVTRSGSVSCRRAKRIVKSFIRNHRAWRKHGDGIAATTYFTLGAYPRWRCWQGSGGGSCRRGKSMAVYSNALR